METMKFLSRKEKEKIKSRAKWFMGIAYGCAFLSILSIFLILISSSAFGAPLGNFMPALLAISLFIFPAFAGLIFALYSQLNSQKLMHYAKFLRVYRTRKIGIKILEAIKANDLDSAVNMYRNFNLMHEKRLCDIIAGMIIGAWQYTDSHKEKGLLTIDHIEELYDPNKIN